MRRPDLGAGFDGWQVVDPTPQEKSAGESLPQVGLNMVLWFIWIILQLKVGQKCQTLALLDIPESVLLFLIITEWKLMDKVPDLWMLPN